MRLSTRFLILILFSLVVVACTPSDEPIPTLIPVSTSTPVEATNTPIPTATATSTPQPTPNIPRTLAQSPNEQAYLRVIHAAPSLLGIDTYIEDLNVASSMNYGQFTDQSGIVAGDYTIRVVASGGRLADSVLAETDVSITGNDSLLIVVMGTANAPVVNVFREDITPLPNGKSRLNTINALNSGETYTIQDELANVMNASLDFGTISTGNIVDTFFHTLGIQSGDTRIIDYPINLRERQTYTLVIAGTDVNSDDVTVIPIATGVDGIVSIRLLGGLSGFEILDVYLNGSYFGTVSNGTESERIILPAQVYDVDLYPEGSNISEVAPLVSTQITARAGNVVSVVAVGQDDNIRLVTVNENTEETPFATARVAFVNASPNGERIAIDTLLDMNLQLNFAKASEYIEFPAEPITLQWFTTEGSRMTDNLVEELFDFELEAGNNYLYLVTGRDNITDGVDALIFQETVGENRFLVAEDSPDNDRPVIQTLPPAPRIRLVNAAPGLFVELRVSDNSLAQQVPHTRASEWAITTPQEHIVTIHDESGRLLARNIVSFEAGMTYTAVFSDHNPDYYVDIFTDELMQGYNNLPARFRLINVSKEEGLQLGLSYGVPQEIEPFAAPLVPSEFDDIVNTSIETDPDGGSSDIPPDPDNPSDTFGNPDTNAVENPFRRSIPVGFTDIIQRVDSSTASQPQSVIAGLGMQNFYIIDENEQLLAQVIPFVDIQDGVQYDVVAYQLSSSLEIRVFILPYVQP